MNYIPIGLQAETLVRICDLVMNHPLRLDEVTELSRALLTPGNDLRRARVNLEYIQDHAAFRIALASPTCQLRHLRTWESDVDRDYTTRLNVLSLLGPAPGAELDRLPPDIFRLVAACLL